ncbi:hypothetical protein K3495_g10096 [Podosphaera aphanis]|nr:hypothetical protein K3495_g10096 [Podosphaera aphanis]
MVHTSVAAPSLSLAQLQAAPSELRQHKNKFLERKTSDIEFPVTEVVNSIFTAQQAVDHKAILPSIQSQGYNRGLEDISTSAIADSAPHPTLESNSETSKPGLNGNPHTVSVKKPFAETSTLAPLSVFNQSSDIFSVTKLDIRTNTFNNNFNKTTLTPSSSSSIFNPSNSSAIGVSTPSNLAFVSLIESTSNPFPTNPTSITTNLTPFPSPQIVTSSFIGVSSSAILTSDGSKNEETTTSSNSAASPTSSSERSSSESKPVAAIAGGVAGGIAGVALIIILILFLLRRHRNNKIMLLFGSSTAITSSSSRIPSGQPPGEILPRQPRPYISAALASFTRKKKSSQKPVGTTSVIHDNERGFYRVSGRKLPSVMNHGGDGYGGFTDEPNIQSASSLCRELHLFRGGSPNPSTSIRSFSATQPVNGMPIVRSSPSQNLVAEEEPSVNSDKNQLRQPDALGRSRPSLDASHTSRFTEEL